MSSKPTTIQGGSSTKAQRPTGFSSRPLLPTLRGIETGPLDEQAPLYIESRDFRRWPGTSINTKAQRPTFGVVGRHFSPYCVPKTAGLAAPWGEQ
jgi:hypothetical protein